MSIGVAVSPPAASFSQSAAAFSAERPQTATDESPRWAQIISACISAWVPVPTTPSVASVGTGFSPAARAPAAAVRTLVSQHSSWSSATGRPVSAEISRTMPPAPGKPRAAFR